MRLGWAMKQSSKFPSPQPGTKVIYLVRHAESEENVRVRAFDRAYSRLVGCQRPDITDVWSGLGLLSFDLDAPLSSEGERQLVDVKQQFQRSNFVHRSGVQLVANSTRQRAIRTREALFGSSSLPVHELEDMVERTPLELLTESSFAERVDRVRQWIADQPETCMALVGHGEFFRRLQMHGNKVAVPLGNVEVRRCFFDIDTKSFDAGTRVAWPRPPTFVEPDELKISSESPAVDDISISPWHQKQVSTMTRNQAAIPSI